MKKIRLLPYEEPVTTEFFRPNTQFFIFFPANRRRIEGKSRLISSVWGIAFSLLMIILMAALLLMVTFYVIGQYQSAVHLNADGQSIEGVVVAKQTHASTGKRDPSWSRIIYSYEINKFSYWITEYVSYNAYQTINKGDQVSAIYLPDQPSISARVETARHDEIVAENNLETLRWVWLFYLPVAAYYGIRFWNYLRLTHRGELIDGKIAGVQDAGMAIPQVWTFIYAFTSPKSGKSIQRMGKVTGSLSGAPLPRVGTEVKVLYLNDRNFQVM